MSSLTLTLEAHLEYCQEQAETAVSEWGRRHWANEAEAVRRQIEARDAEVKG